ncbi:MAG: hypothetical protein IPG17_18675 [Sandaracinaceae bacterium]|nr:hypothetical protein [Sandaracinaceae bacterium]MBK7153203.1 hypothetical protein [Sandaracinaceae bacterium]MBK7775125.1 hypothetical protein [Sandaracinaceae bacterium]MBK8408406.1 hypothetical protein [Sandaracinaceae bacterium]
MLRLSPRPLNAALVLRTSSRRALSALAGLALMACGDASEPADSTSDMDVNPLPLVAQSDWQPAQDTCEGMMSGAVEYGVAEGEPDLLVAIGPRGVVCVDTFLVFENELGPDSLAMERIWLRYMATLQELGPELAGDQRDASIR